MRRSTTRCAIRSRPLYQRFGQDANEILGHLLLLETIVIRIDDRTYAIAAPTHPLYPLALRPLRRDRRRPARPPGRPRPRARRSGRRAAAVLPDIDLHPLDRGQQRGQPHLPEPAGTTALLRPRDRRGRLRRRDASIRALVEAQLALEPHSQQGYRLGLVDPPDAGSYLTMLADLADDGKLSGATSPSTGTRGPRSASSCDSTRPRRIGSHGSSARSRPIDSSRSRSASCRGRNSDRRRTTSITLSSPSIRALAR